VVSAPTLADARDALDTVHDPEVPVLTINDLGILRDVAVDDDAVTVTITPTYSGCPAMDHIKGRIEETLRGVGFADVTVETVLSPAWTTDWMTEEGKRKLEEFGIASPRPTTVTLRLPIRCPHCGSKDTSEVSRFGSTACKALHRCNACLEPFDHFKEI
jgi:ring-1,2-phenylacetyl-CoA epoxidase subunit PaaD